jgi:hypothetical protein
MAVRFDGVVVVVGDVKVVTRWWGFSDGNAEVMRWRWVVRC